MGRFSVGHPIAEISDLYYFYHVLGEEDPKVVEEYMGFPYETAREFFRLFLISYLNTDEEEKLRDVTDKASLLCHARLIHKIRRQQTITEKDRETIRRTPGFPRFLSRNFRVIRIPSGYRFMEAEAAHSGAAA